MKLSIYHSPGIRRGYDFSLSAKKLTPAMAEAVWNCTSGVNGWMSEPYSVIPMFIVTVPLLAEATGGVSVAPLA